MLTRGAKQRINISQLRDRSGRCKVNKGAVGPSHQVWRGCGWLMLKRLMTFSAQVIGGSSGILKRGPLWLISQSFCHRASTGSPRETLSLTMCGETRALASKSTTPVSTTHQEPLTMDVAEDVPPRSMTGHV